jgi:plastocyanin
MSAVKLSFSMHNFAASTGTTVTFTIREQTHPVVPVQTTHKARVRCYVVEGE